MTNLFEPSTEPLFNMKSAHDAVNFGTKAIPSNFGPDVVSRDFLFLVILGRDMGEGALRISLTLYPIR